MWPGRGFGFGRGGWGVGPRPGFGRGNPTPYCRLYPYLPKGWWAASSPYLPWQAGLYYRSSGLPSPWGGWAGQGYGNWTGYRW